MTVTPGSGRAFRDGLVTSLANPKLAVFFVALFPQSSSRAARCCPRRC
jgi:threonine/homoserine/homoserine lactone efflux protein